MRRSVYIQSITIKRTLCLLIMLCTLSRLMAQDNGWVTGSVTDTQGEPIVGAVVGIVENKQKTVTDIDGNFKIEGTEGQTITVSFIGMHDYKGSIKATSLKIVLQSNSSLDTKIEAVVVLDQTVCITQVKNYLGTPDFEDIKSHRQVDSISDDVVHINMHASDIVSHLVQYNHEDIIDDTVKNLSDKELAYLSVGNFDPNAKFFGTIGNASSQVAGAAGETTTLLKDNVFVRVGL